MTARISNVLQRNLSSMFPWAFSNQRHNFERDYGWPEHVTFPLLFQASRRNGIARAAVDKTSLRTWKALPDIWESEEPVESPLESDIRQHFEDIRFWQACIEADRRAYVGGYAGLILRFADSKPFDQPVDRVSGGIAGLVKVEPVWSEQLKVTDWDTDQSSPDFGQPTMYEMRESSVTDDRASDNIPRERDFPIHPDRVIIWSRDGTVHARSDLEPGFNDLIDIQKIKGAGGEGFWKNAKAMPVIEVDPAARLEDMAQAMGVPVADVKAALDDEVNDFQLGFNKVLMLAGMTAKPINITMPQPKEFLDGPLMSFAASVSMPVRVLIGNETGERASTEDQNDFNSSCMARRQQYIIPTLHDLLNRLERVGILQEKDYTINWESLFDMSPDDKMARAKQMADINKTTAGPMSDGQPIFPEDEIRAEAGFEALESSDGSDDEKPTADEVIDDGE